MFCHSITRLEVISLILLNMDFACEASMKFSVSWASYTSSCLSWAWIKYHLKFEHLDEHNKKVTFYNWSYLYMRCVCVCVCVCVCACIKYFSIDFQHIACTCAHACFVYVHVSNSLVNVLLIQWTLMYLPTYIFIIFWIFQICVLHVISS